MAKVLAPGPLPDLSVGPADGVPVVEYGSLTCPHCAVFSKETFPQLKKDYIDTGKVRFIFREFARNTLDVAGFVLARCLGDDKAFAADELLFAEQDKWAFVDKPLEPLIAAMRPTGMTQAQATECLKNQKLADGIVAQTKAAERGDPPHRHADLRHRRQGLRRRTDHGPAEGDPRSAGEEVRASGAAPPSVGGSPGRESAAREGADRGADERRKRIPGRDEERRIVRAVGRIEERGESRPRRRQRARPSMPDRCGRARPHRDDERRQDRRGHHRDHRRAVHPVVADEASHPLAGRNDCELDRHRDGEQDQRREKPKRERARLRLGTREADEQQQRRQGER